MVALSNIVKRGCRVDKVQVLNEVLTLPESMHPLSMLQNPGGAIKPRLHKSNELDILGGFVNPT